MAVHKHIMRSGVYAIRCINGNFYVGSTSRLCVRWRTHQISLERGAHHSDRLQNAWNKYGPGAFIFGVLEYVEPARMIEVEQQYIERLQSADSKSGFNICPIAGRGRLGLPATPRMRAAVAAANRTRVCTPETRARIAAAHKGNKYGAGHIKSPEHRAKISAANLGREVSLEVREKISASHMGIKPSAETLAKLRARRHAEGTLAKLRGRTFSPEHCARISAAKQVISPETRARMSAAQLGKKQSAETRAKVAAAGVGRRHSPETRAKMSRAAMGNKRALGHVQTAEHRAKLDAAREARRRETAADC